MTKKKSPEDNLKDLLSALTDDTSSGFRYTHSRLTVNTKKVLEASAFLYALIELLDEKGIMPIKEIDERMKEVAGRLVKKYEESRVGLLHQDPEEDKYTFNKHPNINCGDRLKTCKAVCCKIPFALSKQDVEEGKVRWEFGRPYLIGHDEDGYCTHIDRETFKCGAYEKRPLPCRGFDCRENEKWPVWKDFDKKVVNKEFDKQVDESCETMYRCPL